MVYNVNAGNSYSGQYVQLDVDIDITRGMGVYNENPDSAAIRNPSKPSFGYVLLDLRKLQSLKGLFSAWLPIPPCATKS